MLKIIVEDDQIFQLPDGRKLSYAKYGQETGKPVIFFHGIPGSRLQRNPDLSIFKKAPLLVYALDRPGYGDSTFYKQRTLLDWPDDVAAFAAGNQLEKFAVIGISGGGPYALACACKIPNRLSQVTVLSGLAPLNVKENLHNFSAGGRLLFRAAENTPLLVEQLMALLFNRLHINLDAAFQKFMTDLPPADTNLLAQPKIARMLQQDVAQAFNQGAKGVVHDISILRQSWGFSLDQIALPVHVWHGTADTIVPLQLGRFMIDHLPYAIPYIIENEGHFMALERMGEIFGTVV